MPTISAAKMAMSHVKNVVFGGRSILSSSALPFGTVRSDEAAFFEFSFRQDWFSAVRTFHAKINAGTAATGIVEGLGAMKQSNSKRLVLNQIKFNNVF